MINLYNSGKFELLGTETTGKKEITSRFYFRGMPSVFGDGKEVLSIIDGTVIYAGRELKPGTREYAYKRHVKVLGKDGLCVIYAYLGHCAVRVGDQVVKGQVVGIEGANKGIGAAVMVELRRAGRRVNGYEVLGLRKEGQQIFDFTAGVDREELVCDVCGLSKNIRAYINSHPEADEFWESVARHLAVAE